MTQRAPAKEFPADLEWVNATRAPQLAELRGRVILLWFWTYDCVNCWSVVPDLRFLEDKYHDGLTVVGVHSPEISAAGAGRGRAARGEPASPAACGRERSRFPAVAGIRSDRVAERRADRCRRPLRGAVRRRRPARRDRCDDRAPARGSRAARPSRLRTRAAGAAARAAPAARVSGQAARRCEESLRRRQRSSPHSRMHARRPRAAPVRIGQSRLLRRPAGRGLLRRSAGARALARYAARRRSRQSRGAQDFARRTARSIR